MQAAGLRDVEHSMSDKPNDKPDNEAEKRQRETVDKLLARAPAVSTGAVTLAHGHRLDYEVSAAFMPRISSRLSGNSGHSFHRTARNTG